MDQAYPLLRHEINNSMPLQDFKKRWPFFFEARWFLLHFHKLTGIEISTILPKALEEKKTKILEYARSVGKDRVKQLVQGISNLDPVSIVQLIMALLEENLQDLIVLDTDVSSILNINIHRSYPIHFRFQPVQVPYCDSCRTPRIHG